MRGVGRSTDSPVVIAGNGAGGATVAPSPVPDDFATRLSRVGPESFVSWGHAGGRYVSTVFVTLEAKDLLGRGAGDPATGTLVVMTHKDRARGAGPTYFMQKQDAGWRFGVVGAVDAFPGIALCARCHAEAPHGQLFTLPPP